MSRCLISFGANIGNSLDTIRLGLELLQTEMQCGTGEFRLSRYFRTPPVGGPPGQPPFVNAVAAVETRLSPSQVWQAIRTVEQALGRERNRRWEARRIDLDILLYENHRIWTEQLKIPHPRMCMRRFILVPAQDVAGHWIDPVSKWTVNQLGQSLQQGAGNLLLVAPTSIDIRGILRDVAALALASIVEPAQGVTSLPQSRWVAATSYESFSTAPHSRLPAKLTVFLNEPRSDESTAWEIRHQYLAYRLGLAKASAPSESVFEQPSGPIVIDVSNFEGPRYLLAVDDRDWAVHEIVAALEAMDCPVEPIESQGEPKFGFLGAE